MELKTSVKRLPKNFATVLPNFGKTFKKFIPALPAIFQMLFNP